MGLFTNASVQNINIGNNVLYANGNMANMFLNCFNFNSPILIPDNVTNLSWTFRNCSSFNQPISIPNSVTNMVYAFYNCTAFNQPITVSIIPNTTYTNLDSMLSCCTGFNQPVTFYTSDVKVRAVTMFYNCYNFNQPIQLPAKCASWYRMFYGCRNFNQPITIRNNSGAWDASGMFDGCFNFNSDVIIGTGINSLNTTFRDCIKFGGNLTIYENNLTNMNNMFYGRYSNGTVPLLNIFCDNRSNTYNYFRYGNSNATKRAFPVNISWVSNGQYVYNSAYNVKLSIATRF